MPRLDPSAHTGPRRTTSIETAAATLRLLFRSFPFEQSEFFGELFEPVYPAQNLQVPTLPTAALVYFTLFHRPSRLPVFVLLTYTNLRFYKTRTFESQNQDPSLKYNEFGGLKRGVVSYAPASCLGIVLLSCLHLIGIKTFGNRRALRWRVGRPSLLKRQHDICGGGGRNLPLLRITPRSVRCRERTIAEKI